MPTIEQMKVLEYYPYRSARIIGDRITFPREEMRSFEEALAKLAGVPTTDNHVCYHVYLGNRDKPKIYVMFSDFWMYLGDKIEKRYW